MRNKFTRDFEAGGYLDLFLVTAVVTILLIRLVLQITGFPQLGGDHLHIAHMLWGGLLMLVSIIVLLSFIGRSGNKLAAVIGGAGFGTFIDEVGKFVTQDNDYFFQPSLSIIYVLFIMTYIGVRWIHQDGTRTQLEYLLNALMETQEIAKGDLDRNERDRALEYLSHCDPDNRMAGGMKGLLARSETIAPAAPDFLVRTRRFTADIYRKLVSKPRFGTAVIVFFISQMVITVLHLTFLLLFHKSWGEVLLRRPIESLANEATHISYFDGTIVVFTGLSAVLVAIGAWQIRRSRLQSFRMFQRSILVSIFFIQPMMFYRDQWAALIGLTFDIIVFATLRFVIEHERTTPRPD